MPPFYSTHNYIALQYLTQLTVLQLLLKHFGLEAFFATTRRNENETVTWPEHSSYRWHHPEEVETTICYLTLPRRSAKEKTFPISELEADCGSSFIQGLQSCLIKLPDMRDHDKRVKQFRGALRTLKLKPYFHPSQLHDTVSADMLEPTTKSTSSSGGTEDHPTQSGKSLKMPTWLQ